MAESASDNYEDFCEETICLAEIAWTLYVKLLGAEKYAGVWTHPTDPKKSVSIKHKVIWCKLVTAVKDGGVY